MKKVYVESELWRLGYFTNIVLNYNHLFLEYLSQLFNISDMILHIALANDSD